MPKHNVFAYGTLTNPSVWKAVTGEKSKSCKAVLFGYQNYWVKNAAFPGIVEDNDEIVKGLLYFNVSKGALNRLDMYEGGGVMYDRKVVTVKTVGFYSQRSTCFVYVWKDKDSLGDPIHDYYWRVKGDQNVYS